MRRAAVGPVLASALIALLATVACGDSRPQGGPKPAPAPAPGAASGEKAGAKAGAATAAFERKVVARPAALQAWIDRTAAEVGVPTMGADEARALPADRVVVDVREPAEIAVSMIPLSMALTSEPARSEFVRKGGDQVVLVSSTVGWRAAAYCRQLREAGVKAFVIEGGVCGWAAAGGRLVDPQGRISRSIHVGDASADCVPEGYTAVLDG